MKKIIILTSIIIIIVGAVLICTYNLKIIPQKNESIIQNINNEEDSKKQKLYQDEVIGILVIEKIGLTGEIKEGSDKNILKNNIGHIEITPRYKGNVGLAAHNRGNKYSYFERINELEKGDKVVYKTKYGDKKYVVDKKEVIDETDWNLLANTVDNRISMITCIKNKPNQRLCVQAIETK